MPRQRREKSSTGFYHVMLHGINKNELFLEDDDREYFLKVIAEKKVQEGFCLNAYCLMDTHVHLLLKEADSELAVIMKRINICYASFFNHKYARTGPVFHDRYKSERIENERYLLAAARYIHQNPVKAHIVVRPEHYRWSSYCEYLSSRPEGIVDTGLLLSLFGCRAGKPSAEFKEFMTAEEHVKFLDVRDRQEGRDQACELWQSLANINYDEKSKVVRLKNETGVSERTLSQITGLGRTKIRNLLR